MLFYLLVHILQLMLGQPLPKLRLHYLAKQLERLVEGLHKSFGWEDAEEVTFECEPGTLSKPKVQPLK